MKRLAIKSALAVLMILALIFALEAGLASTQEKIRFSYRQTTAATKVETVEIGDVKGHFAGMTQYEGYWVITSGPKTLDGASVSGVTFWDAVEGNGTGHGYAKVVKGSNNVFLRFEMKIITEGSATGPIVSYEGTRTFTKGTGELEGIQGGGTFRGSRMSKTISVMEGETEYWIEK